MPKFFVDSTSIRNQNILIDTEDVSHITKVLRYSVGDEIEICDGRGVDYTCVIEEIQKNAVSCKIILTRQNDAEPNIKVSLFMALPKGDKMDFIIQKAVELGVYEIIPFEAIRCVVKLDKKSAEKKVSKWQKIALEAAKQCGRGYVPKVFDVVTFRDALNFSKQSQATLFLYEKEKMQKIENYLKKDVKSVAVFIGPEGGFDEKEVFEACDNGAHLITLGKRILRLETASLCVLSVIMYVTQNL